MGSKQRVARVPRRGSPISTGGKAYEEAPAVGGAGPASGRCLRITTREDAPTHEGGVSGISGIGGIGGIGGIRSFMGGHSLPFYQEVVWARELLSLILPEKIRSPVIL